MEWKKSPKSTRTVAALVCRHAAALTVLMLLAGLPAQAQNDEAFTTLDDEYLAIAQEIPGFGGLFYDGDVPKVYLTDMTQRDAVARYTEGEVQFLAGNFAFDQLYAWRVRLVDVLAEPGVVYLDIDEKRNRVDIGVSSEISRRAAFKHQIASRFGVPEEALTVTETEPVLPAATLRDLLRPAPGGIQINSPSFFCTLGYITKQNGIFGFVTNSHCTNQQGGTENTPFWQPTQSSANLLGSETKDPNYFTGGACPSGRICRRSDSAMVRLSSNSLSLGQYGWIARPTCSNCGSLTIASGSNSRFKIKGAGSISVGKTLHKVGRTTGWTHGNHSQSCADIPVTGTNFTLLCQDRVDASVAGGDSGSPVFLRKDGNNIKIAGLLWGRTSSGSQFLYSPIGSVKNELGSFSMH